ncbi:SHOCT domain-containing protein [Sphingomonas sp. WKB10]|nr:SHOCT domain-containing protein [Sphingomonas sp. WKB10]
MPTIAIFCFSKPDDLYTHLAIHGGWDVQDLDRLEQLARLRDQGAITEAEFEQQKARLLNAEKPRLAISTWALIAGAAVVVFVLAAVLFGGSRQSSADSPNANVTFEDASTSVDNGSETVDALPVAAPTLPSEGGYVWATSQDMLGLNPAFVESKLGPAREKSAASLEYRIAGCRVYYGVKNGKIDFVTADVSPNRHPQVDGKTITERTTFSDVASEGSVVAECISFCGNAYDPTIDFFVPGSHARGFVQTYYTGAIGDPTSKAQELWVAAIRLKHGVGADDFGNSNPDWFTCAADAPASVVAAMAPEHISSVTFGYSVGTTCKYS